MREGLRGGGKIPDFAAAPGSVSYPVSAKPRTVFPTAAEPMHGGDMVKEGGEKRHPLPRRTTDIHPAFGECNGKMFRRRFVRNIFPTPSAVLRRTRRITQTKLSIPLTGGAVFLLFSYHRSLKLYILLYFQPFFRPNILYLLHPASSRVGPKRPLRKRKPFKKFTIFAISLHTGR